MGQGSVSFPPQELEALAIFNGHEAMSAKVANARLQADLGITLQKLAAANEALAKTAAERDAAIVERDAAITERDALRAEIAAARAPLDVPKTPPLLPAGGVDEEVALAGAMGG